MLSEADEARLDSLDRLQQMANALRHLVVTSLRSVSVAGINDERVESY